MTGNLETLACHALAEGRTIDLTDCYWGEAPNQQGFIATPALYYFFLAGLVHTQRLNAILEIGTHFGGAIKAMSRGVWPADSQNGRLVTVDIELRNKDGFRDFGHIIRITGDACSSTLIEKVASCFISPIDLLFIDAVHTYEATKANINAYALRLSPKYVVLDDIHLNESMQRLWDELVATLGSRCFDASELCRPELAGLGLIEWR